MRALGLSPGERAQRAARVWSFDDKPFNYVTTYVPESIGKAWTRTDMEVTPLAGLLERSGVEVSLVRERVTATLTDTHLSSYLGVEVGSPVLKIYRTAFDPAGRAVEYLIGFYRPDRYQYEVELPR